MPRNRATTLMLLSAATALTVTACSHDDTSTSVTPITTEPQVSQAFDPCTDLSREFILKYGFNPPPGYERPDYLGGDPGRVVKRAGHRAIGCTYRNRNIGTYTIEIAVTDAELNEDGPEPGSRIGDRRAEISGPVESETPGPDLGPNGTCYALIDMAVGTLYMSIWRAGQPNTSETDACIVLANMATEIVAMLPPGS